MPKPRPGQRTPGSGRVKGTPNKVTSDVRTALAELARSNAANAQKWLQQAANKDPARALELYLRLLEYYVPKLARSEISGPEGVPIVPRAIVVPRKEIPVFSCRRHDEEALLKKRNDAKAARDEGHARRMEPDLPPYTLCGTGPVPIYETSSDSAALPEAVERRWKQRGQS